MAKATQATHQEWTQIDAALARGNYRLVRRLAEQMMQAGGEAKHKAAVVLKKIGIDPLVVWIGVGTVAFIGLVAWWQAA